jgi:hypothetical protein
MIKLWSRSYPLNLTNKLSQYFSGTFAEGDLKKAEEYIQ